MVRCRDARARSFVAKVLGGSQSPSGRYGEVKILDPTENRNSGPFVAEPVASRYSSHNKQRLFCLSSN
jgi:hypothetical protein